MRCASKVFRRLALAIALGWPLAACGVPEPAATIAAPVARPCPPQPPPAQERTLRLAPGPAAEWELAGGQAHAYRFDLPAGWFAHLVVEQRGIDVVVSLRDAGGRLLARSDHWNGAQGPEPMPVIAATAAGHRLEIRSQDREAPAGRYALRIEALRPATSRDRTLLAAERAFAEAEALRQRRDGPSLRGAAARDGEALALFRQLGERSRQADVLHGLGEIHQALGEPAAALASYREALPLFRALGLRRETADALRGLGVARVALGDTEGALASYHEALAIDRSLGEREAEATVLACMARAYTLLGKMEQALDAHERELALWRQLRRPDEEGYALINLGRAYALLGRPQRAIDHFTRGLPRLQAAGRELQAAGALVDLGRALARSGREREGVAALERSLSLQRRLGNRTGEAVALGEIGSLHELGGRKDQARRFYGLALPILREVGDRLRESMVLASVGRLQEDAGDLPGAAATYARMLRLSAVAGYRSGEAAAFLGLARVRRRRGDLRGARQAAESALDRVEALRVEPASPELRASFLAGNQEYYELYVDLLMALHRREPEAGHAGRAFEASELARARSLLDSLAQTRADLRRGIEPRLLELEAELGNRVNAAQRRRLSLAESGAPATRIEAAERELRELLLRSERLRDRIRRTASGYAALSQAHPAHLSEVRQRILDPDTMLLEYALGRERSFLWAVTSTSLAAYELPPRAVIEETARRTLLLLGASHRTLARAGTEVALAELSRLLLGPLAGRLPKRLLVVGDGALHTVPFAALPIPGRGGTAIPLIAEHEVLSLPSASALVELRRRSPAPRPGSPLTVAVLADPVFAADDPRIAPRALAVPASLRRGPARGRFDRLPFSRLEAAAILTLLPPERRLAALGLAASRQSIMNGDLASYRIVHFATHGALDSRYPELSGIALSMVDERGNPRDGFLRVHDVYRLDLPADLVVLSACDTALGREMRGEGLIGLTRAFFAAGARRVLVSLWPVEDRATAELMRRFYREMLLNGLPPSAALRAAQTDLKTEPGWQAPYYWAGFVLQGDWR